MSSRSLTCLITGKKYTFNSVYFDKKVESYGDVETLKKYFITRKAKSYLMRGYSVDEIRKILDVEECSLLDSDSREVRDIVSYYQRNNIATKRTNSVVLDDKTDKEVAVFINNIKNTL
jgi:hypothetical protein